MDETKNKILDNMVDLVCRKPSMYVGRADLELVMVYLWGHYSRELGGISKLEHGEVMLAHPWLEFQDWLASKLDCAPGEILSKIRELYKNDEEGISYFLKSYNDFIKDAQGRWI